MYLSSLISSIIEMEIICRSLVKLIMMIFLLQLLLIMKSTTAQLSSNHDDNNNNTSYIDYVNKSCNATTMYPRLCYTSLSPYADAIQTDPKLLANTSLSVALHATESSSTFLKWLGRRNNKGGLKPREARAINDCVEEVVDSVEELKLSLREMTRKVVGSSAAFEFQMSNIETWVSAALTDDDTCLDGLDEVNVNPRTKKLVRLHMVRVAQLTSNALALVNYYAKSRA